MAFAIMGKISTTRLRVPTMALATATRTTMGIFMSFVIHYLVKQGKINLEGKAVFIFGGLGALSACWN
ncbi:Maltose permease MAL31-like protein 2 [Apiospora saccharicola]|uniref:Maltose permease MAL31-like protein 2 n=1 Tax=Apiospora saccharicola TaxID=335842 RepID=A0ABR1WKB4_9PEZI